jgi:Ca-activated chloride channel homolog
MNPLNVILTPLRQGAPRAGRVEVDLLLRVQAPELPAEAAAPRAPLHLAVVLDRSGSMSGQPLAEARRCAAAIAARLASGDQLALVAYDHRATLVQPCRPVQDLVAFQSLVNAIEAGGYTDPYAGWATGVEALRRAHRPGVVSRVLLLSDGQANQGITDPDMLASAARNAAEVGISTSTYGLGEGFEENLMTAMAQQGAGRSYYGETAEDLMDPFMEEFDLLSSLVARRLQVAVDVPRGWTVSQLNHYPELAPGCWRMPDLAAKAEAWALFHLEGAIPEGYVGDTLLLANLTLQWDDPKGLGSGPRLVPARLPVLSDEAFRALPEDPLVASRLLELRVGELQEQAHRAALADDWDEVRRLLDEMKALAAENPWTLEIVASLEELMRRGERDTTTKELRFGSSAIRYRLTSLNEEAECQPTASYTRRKRRQGKGGPLGSDTPGEPG